MGFFNFDLRRALTLIILTAIPLISIQLQKVSGKEPWVFKPFLFLASGSQSVHSTFSHKVIDTVDLYFNLIKIKSENRALKADAEKNNIALAELQELKLENQRLSQLLQFKESTPMDLTPARVVGRDILAEYQSITIDRGEADNIKSGMAVITSSGAVGYIAFTGKRFSHVLLLTDRYAVIDVAVQRSRARGILSGRGGDELDLKYLRRGDDVQVGDQIITSGLDNIFPKGLIIGTVVSVEKSEYGFEQIVRVKPNTVADNLEEVFIVRNSKNFDFEITIQKSDTTNKESDKKGKGN
jgi:rod shape-determining protein MreC